MGYKKRYILYCFLGWLFIVLMLMVNSRFNILSATFISYSIASAMFIYLIYVVLYERKVEKIENMQNEFRSCKDKKKYTRCNYTKNGNIIYLKKGKKVIR